MPKKLTHEQVIEKIKQIHGDKIVLLGEYKNSKTKIKTLCKKCDYTWECQPYDLYKGHGCPKCAKNLKKDTNTFKEEVLKLVGNEYTVLGEYVNTHTKILIRHNECGNEFYMSPKAFLGGQRCPNERYIKSSKANMIKQGNPQEKNKLLKEKCEKEGYLLKGEYKGSNVKIKMQHLECGCEFEVTPYCFLSIGSRCPKCRISKGEKAIREYLENNQVNFKEQYRIKECKNIRPLPFDFAIFNNDILICLIEYDGSQHYHRKFNYSEKDFARVKENDKIKSDFCKINNIPLIRIKYVRSDNIDIFNKKVIERLKDEFAKHNMVIPSQAREETPRRCRD